MENEKKIVEEMEDFLEQKLFKVTVPRKRRIFASIEKNALKEAIKFLVNVLKLKHLSTITGLDLGEEIEVIYHLAYEGSIVLSMKLAVSKKDPNVPSIVDIIPGAALYEREVHDLLGITFQGNPDLSPLVLPEDWPQGVYPLRKEHGIEQLRKLTSKHQ